MLARPIKALESTGLTHTGRRDHWIRNEYEAFGLSIRHDVLLAAARFCHINRPMQGYYFEFGSHGANTMRMAWDVFHHLFDWTFVAFDSFRGLPEISGIDQQEIWQQGKLRTEKSDFIATCERHGMPPDRLITVEGFYEDSLTEELRDTLAPNKAAVIYIDCDLYESTVPVLNFVRDFLQRGTVVVFDDWNCFYGDPERGQRRAFREFLDREPHLRFEPFIHTSEPNAFIFVGESKDAGRSG